MITTLKMPLDVSLETFDESVLFAEFKHLEFAPINRIGQYIQKANFDDDPAIVVIIAGQASAVPLEIFERELDESLEKLDVDLSRIQWQQIPQ